MCKAVAKWEESQLFIFSSRQQIHKCKCLVLQWDMLRLPVHKPAWWAGPLSLTLLTNMVSMGSIRLF